MRKKKGFTLIELLVVIAIIAMLLAILMPALSKVKKIAQRVVCATNLKGMGTAQMVYANDYDDEYVVQGAGAAHTWNATSGNEKTSGWQDPLKNWKTAGNITVGASLYLLVREADVSPKSFICPSGSKQEFTGKNINNLDIVELWDFGAPDSPEAEGPTNCVSYSYHNPYNGTASTGSKGSRAPDGSRSAAFAIMADQNPYQSDKLISLGAADQTNFMEYAKPIGAQTIPADGDFEDLLKWQIQVQNAQSHDRESQNVLFGDGHASNEKRADVGVKYDCIYTQWSATTGTSEAIRRRGTKPTNRDTDFVPLGNNDSVLVNDDATID